MTHLFSLGAWMCRIIEFDEQRFGLGHGAAEIGSDGGNGVMVGCPNGVLQARCFKKRCLAGFKRMRGLGSRLVLTLEES